mgnify:CR=1 FL=1
MSDSSKSGSNGKNSNDEGGASSRKRKRVEESEDASSLLVDDDVASDLKEASWSNSTRDVSNSWVPFFSSPSPPHLLVSLQTPPSLSGSLEFVSDEQSHNLIVFQEPTSSTLLTSKTFFQKIVFVL